MATALELLALAQIAQLVVPVNIAPQSTTASGTPTTATNEIRDDILGVYQCTLTAGRRYMAIMNGLVGNASAAGDVYAINIRNSGTSSTPTAASTLVVQQSWVASAVGTAGRAPIPLAGSFIAPATGTNTFAFFAQRTGGTGVFTPLSPAVIARELFVMYLGTV